MTAADRALADVMPLIKAVLRRKSGLSLAPDDARPDNVDALDLYHDVVARVWERLRDAAGDVGDVRAYAATIAHNAWSDYLRERYPRRASLKNRLRYFLGKQPRYAAWETADGDWVGGLRAWQLEARAVRADALVDVRNGTRRLAPGSVPARDCEHYAAQDWDRLLGALFAVTAGPVPIDDLVAAVATLTGLKEDRVESLADDGDDDMASAAETLADEGPTPEAIAETKSSLAALWAAILALKHDYRCAYLLNVPGAGRTRGDLDVFPQYGVASVDDIGRALDLAARQYAIAWRELGLEEALPPAIEASPADAADFARLWPHLPLEDLTIAAVMELARQQVINRRMLALKALARTLAAHEPRGSARTG
ncbi:MAG: sigma-70 family RNA polymerase sigma factor [Proteobacteria bacterium]|nr:sigma-70 family RNA polymerase sigma factor [Pseudomonadota bacterium]